MAKEATSLRQIEGSLIEREPRSWAAAFRHADGGHTSARIEVFAGETPIPNVVLSPMSRKSDKNRVEPSIVRLAYFGVKRP
jgi:hypothetical protein